MTTVFEPVDTPTAAAPSRTADRRPRPIVAAAQELLAPRPVWVPPTPSALELLTGVGVGTAAAAASPLIAGTLRRLLEPLAIDPARLEPTPEEMGDPGWFGPDSVAWRVHRDGSLLIAGIAAFALQSLHPLAMAGVAEHSAFSTDFLGRTKRTADFVQGVVYGSSTEAARMCRTVYRVHEHVVGVAPDGRPYAANDPDLLHWVHTTEYAAIAAANRRFAPNPMRRADLDTYIDEVARVGLETGVVDPPRSWDEVNAALERHRPVLAIAEYAAAALGFLDDPPIIPGPGKPVWRALWHGAIACLPPVARDLLRVPMPSARELAATRAVLRVLGAPGGEPPRLIAARTRLATT